MNKLSYHKIGNVRLVVALDKHRIGDIIKGELGWVYVPAKQSGHDRIILRRIYNKLYMLEKKFPLND